ncbi:ATP synthase F1 subunit delta [Macrococcoides bohemicum]|uniref:ATP synthase subunit delta n=1 Tax=Macrococcoides bohemicum TaxID=1903056 RepID=A0AAJ4TW67_9STAP|nr:ATP synthase F1 subunit delta [Macrococcus bohemicus]QYA42145.1 ATP synthase F1 subunit delta [Macrococcus bohemicus]QYA44523.1 ATP synthase F1 subunit delta [Macrococcus bohemicus]
MANVLNKYAESLLEVAKVQGVSQSVYSDLLEIKQALVNDSTFASFAEDPKVSKEARIAFVTETFKGVDTPLMNLLKILADRKQLGLIPGIVDAFVEYYNNANQQAKMKVESVYPLSSEELDELGKVFIEKTGYKKLLIENVINESLIGGIRTTIGTTVYDGSVINELNQLSKSFQKQ